MATKRRSKSTRRKLSPEAEARLREREAEQSRHDQMRERNIGRPCYRCGSPTKSFGDHYDEANDRMICWGCQMRRGARTVPEGGSGEDPPIPGGPRGAGERKAARLPDTATLEPALPGSPDRLRSVVFGCRPSHDPHPPGRRARGGYLGRDVAGRIAAERRGTTDRGRPDLRRRLRRKGGHVRLSGRKPSGQRSCSLGLREGGCRGDLARPVDEARAAGETVECPWLIAGTLEPRTTSCVSLPGRSPAPCAEQTEIQRQHQRMKTVNPIHGQDTGIRTT